MKSPIIYYGGKTALASIIARYAPYKMGVYLETFFGSGAVFFYKYSWAKVEIINDINGDVINFFRVLRDKPKRLIEMLQTTPFARQEIQQSTNFIKSSKDDIKRALYFFVRANQSFSGNMRANGGWHIGINRNYAKDWVNKCNSDFLYTVSERLRRASIEHKSAINCLQTYDDPKTFVYHDPPYLSVADAKSKREAYQGFDMVKEDHEKFMAACLAAHSMQIISGYDHPLYNRLIQANWKKIIIPHYSPAGNKSAEKKIEYDNYREEILWISPNIDIPIFHQKMLF